jgi:hypothetical protein
MELRGKEELLLFVEEQCKKRSETGKNNRRILALIFLTMKML